MFKKSKNLSDNIKYVCILETYKHYSKLKLIKMIEELGYIIIDIPNRDTVILCRNKNFNLSRIKKAVKNGIMVLTYDEFFDSIEDTD